MLWRTYSKNSKEVGVAESTVHPLRAKREFDGQQYILTKIDYTREDAEKDGGYYQERGWLVRDIEEDGYWLLYTKIGV